MDYDINEALDEFKNFLTENLGDSADTIITEYADEIVEADADISPIEELIEQMIEEYAEGAKDDTPLAKHFSHFRGQLTAAVNELCNNIKPILEEHAKTLEEPDEA